MKDEKHLLNLATTGLTILTLFGSMFAAFLFLDARHVARSAEFELKAEIIGLDIKKDAEVIAHYRNKELSNTPLISAEKSRYEYLQSEMERKVYKKQLIEQKLMDLE